MNHPKKIIFSIKQTIRYAWEQFTRQALLFILIALGMNVINILFSILQNNVKNPWWLSIVGILNLVVSLGIAVGWSSITLQVARDKTGSMRQFIAHLRKLGVVFIASLLYSIMTLVGFVLLIVPGLYLASRFSLFLYIIIDNDNVGPIAALKKSGELTKGVRWKLLGFMVILALINIAGFMVFFVGTLITVPVTAVAFARAYETLKTGNAPTLHKQAHEPEKSDRHEKAGGSHSSSE